MQATQQKTIETIKNTAFVLLPRAASSGHRISVYNGFYSLVLSHHAAFNVLLVF